MGGPSVFALDPIEVRIESAENIQPGQLHLVDVYIDNIDSNISEIGGYGFLIRYDPSILSFTSAIEGDLGVTCKWALFNTLLADRAWCNTGSCPPGVIKVTGIATLSPSYTPDCYLDTTGYLFSLEFKVADNLSKAVQNFGIEFVWYGCGDNSFSTQGGDSLLISNIVRRASDSAVINDPTIGSYPTVAGAQDADCFSGAGNSPVRFVNFNQGLLSIDFPTLAHESNRELPYLMTLRQNYPNPFNPLTTISFELAKSTNYDLIIYNALGQVIEQFTGHGSPGAHTIEWDGSDHSSGVYFYKLRTGEFEESRKMLLLK